MFKRFLIAFAIPTLALSLMFCSAGKTSELEDPTTGYGSSSSGTGGAPDDAGVGFDVNTGGGNPVKNCSGVAQSFIWIANTGEGTLSKVCTTDGVEVARYITSPQAASGDPSRTSVNMHGDAVVTNRDPSSGPSSVTKFAAAVEDCIDKNNNGQIDTSTGPKDVKPWGEDECMIWNTPLGGGAIGARATAWDGKEDPDTGLGGKVYIGAMLNKTVYKLDGDTGAVLEQAGTALGHYGGAIDNKGNFWTVDMSCTVGLCNIERISVNDLNNHDVHAVHCGYGISVDAKGRVWTAGQNIFAGGGCISRFDPATNENVWVDTGAIDFNRGVAVGVALSAGSVWAANTLGDLIQVDMETMQIVNRKPVGQDSMVGVAIDFEGYVWTVSQGSSSAHKVYSTTWDITTVKIGSSPYTYSDMTGMQLWGVIGPPK